MAWEKSRRETRVCGEGGREGGREGGSTWMHILFCMYKFHPI